MKWNIQWSRAFFLSLLAIIGFGILALLISEHRIARFDDSLIACIQGMESPSLTAVMKALSLIGFLFLVLKHRVELVLLVTAIAGSAILNSLLKAIFQRARPDLHRIVEANGYSFPSGHSMAAFSFYVIVSFLLWKHLPSSLARRILILISTLMVLGIGISRIYLGVHYPSDVLGGYLASGSWLAASIWTYQLYMDRRYRLRLT